MPTQTPPPPEPRQSHSPAQRQSPRRLHGPAPQPPPRYKASPKKPPPGDAISSSGENSISGHPYNPSSQDTSLSHYLAGTPSDALAPAKPRHSLSSGRYIQGQIPALLYPPSEIQMH